MNDDSTLTPIMRHGGEDSQLERLCQIHRATGIADGFRRSTHEAIAQDDLATALHYLTLTAQHRADADRRARAEGVHVAVRLTSNGGRVHQ